MPQPHTLSRKGCGCWLVTGATATAISTLWPPTTMGSASYDADTAVSPQKMRSLSIAANAFVKTYHIEVEVRFDIVTVVGTPEHYEVRHVENAFLPFV